MRSKSTIVGIIYVVGFFIAAYVLTRAFTSLFGVLEISNRAILGDNFTLATLAGVLFGGALLGGLYMGQRSKTFVGDALDEVSKVAWPEWAETKMNTFVVIIFSFVAAAILGVFDAVFAWLTSQSFITG
jgi:preprotein translocase subunit SecE